MHSCIHYTNPNPVLNICVPQISCCALLGAAHVEHQDQRLPRRLGGRCTAEKELILSGGVAGVFVAVVSKIFVIAISINIIRITTLIPLSL